MTDAVANAAKDAVRAEGFSFTYAGQSSPVLEDVTMTVPVGAFAVLCGGTGSGKTTLLKSMTESLAPAGKRAGLMEVFGTEHPKAPDVGFVMQDPESQIVCDTVRRELAFGLENLGMAPDAMRQRMAEVATVFGIAGLADARTADLSGGQKQLVNLAAALAMRPRLLLLDEPTAQLDPVSARQLCDALRLVNGELGLTVLVATHSPEIFADMASCVFELHAGSVREIAVEALRCEQRGIPAVATTPTGEAAPSQGHEPIRLQDVWLTYARDGAWVLKGLSGDIRRGEVSCIVGGNGCGKTTLLKAIAGILKPQRGKVRNDLGQSQAYLPQDPRLLLAGETVGEEVAMAEGAAQAALGIISSAESMLSPLDLSGGQQQMLALAKLLSANPELLILDEPVKGLDADASLRLAELLRGASAAGATVIMATHDLSFASRVADRILLIFDGQVASSASPQGFFDNATFFKPRANGFTAKWDAAHGAHGVGADAAPSNAVAHG